MLDAQFIRDNLEAVKANCRNRNVKADPDQVVRLDSERKKLIQEAQVLQQRAKEVPKLIPKEKDPVKKQELIQEGKRLREQVGALEKDVKRVEADLHAALMTIPNMTHPDAPVGTTGEDNKVLRQWGEPRVFGFPAKDHVALAQSLDLVDFEAGAPGPGEQVFCIKNEAARFVMGLRPPARHTPGAPRCTPPLPPHLAPPL